MMLSVILYFMWQIWFSACAFCFFFIYDFTYWFDFMKRMKEYCLKNCVLYFVGVSVFGCGTISCFEIFCLYPFLFDLFCWLIRFVFVCILENRLTLSISIDENGSSVRSVCSEVVRSFYWLNVTLWLLHLDHVQS